MSACKFPDHHKAPGGAGWLLPATALVAAAVVAAPVLQLAADIAAPVIYWARIAVPSMAGLWLAWRVAWFARLPRAAKRNYPAALWARVRWRWLVRNLGLAYLDQHRKAVRVPFGTSVKVNPSHASEGSARLRFPRARIRPDAFGLVATVRTVPGTGRAEVEKQAPHIANAWRCTRVQVSQPKPGRLIVRGLRTDPLTLPLAADQAPAGVYGNMSGTHISSACHAVDNASDLRKRGTNLYNIKVFRLYLGRDEWGTDRYLDLPGVTGITVGGLPGYGKTSLINSLLMQLAGLPVAFVIIDGKGGGDYTDWADRAWISTGDDLAAAVAALEDVHAEMRRRFGTVLEVTGHRNAWHAGPTPAFPLVVTVLDECHSFLSIEDVKGDRDAERYARICRTMTAQLVKKGRSVLQLVIAITQKQTADAIPTAIRDNCRVGLSFAVKTRDAAVASLGESIREYPSYCPTGLQDSAYVGVATASLRTGHDPFVRLRVPAISEEAAAERARATARIDPTAKPSPRGDTFPLPLEPVGRP